METRNTKIDRMLKIGDPFMGGYKPSYSLEEVKGMLESVMPKFERITFFGKAYDKRDPDPKKDYGIGSVRCFMLLKGEKGVVDFIFSTGMFLDSTMDEYIRTGRGKPEVHNWGVFFLNRPMGFDVGYHSATPMYEGQEYGQKSCEWLDGQPCYCDGSAMRAEEYMNVFLAEGGDKIWEMLEEEYKDRFGEN